MRREAADDLRGEPRTACRVPAAATRSGGWGTRSTRCSSASGGARRASALRLRREPRAAHAAGDPEDRARAGAALGRSPEELRDALRSASEETDRLTQLADDLLVIARTDQGRLPISTEPRGRSRDCWRACAALRAAREEADVRSRVDAPSGLRAELDTLRVEQALGNLVDNALRYGGGHDGPGGARRAGGLELTCATTAPGSRPASRARIRALQPRGRGQRARGGSGLGLAIVQLSPRAHGGRRRRRIASGAGRRRLAAPSRGR